MPVVRSLVSLVAFAALTACGRTSSTASKADAGPPLPPITPSTLPAHATPLPMASIEAMVNPSKMPPYTGPTGSIEGTIRIDGPSAPDRFGDFSSCPEGSSEYAKVFREGPSAADGSRPVADALVVVTGYAGFIPERRDARQVAITGCGLESRTISMTFGQRLEVANRSTQYWAPTLDQAGLPALMVAPPNGDPVKLYAPKPGRYTLSDRMGHPYAQTDVFVMLQPLHAVSDVDGHYRVDGVPVGKVSINALVPSIGNQASGSVDVLANVVQKVDLLVHYVPAPPAGALLGDGGRAYAPLR